MAESSEKDDINVALQNEIEAKWKKIEKLENDLQFLKTRRHDYELTKSVSVDAVEISLSNELKLLHDAEAYLRSDIDAAWKLVNKKRDEVAEIKSANEESEKQRAEELLSFGNKVSEGIPKFRNALRLYSDDNLRKEIEEIGNEDRNIEGEIQGLDQEIKTLVSKYKLDEIKPIAIPGNEMAITELQELEAIWNNANSEKRSVRTLIEHSNKELERKVQFNERKIARLL